MRSLDLFSGVGGFTHGLRDVCTPVAYCEIDPHATRILRERMADGRLPTAPVCPDVSSLDAQQLGAVDIILAGFPCQSHSIAYETTVEDKLWYGHGFSLMGHRTGYEHGASSLYAHVVRLVGELRPALFLLENVPEIVTKGMDHVVETMCHQNGYELRWMVLGAFHLGAPHMRRRWFCLGIRDDVSSRDLLEQTISTHGKGPEPYPWGEMSPPVIMTLSQSRCRRTRCAALGNAVVPDCVRHAFYQLGSLPSNMEQRCICKKKPLHGRCTRDGVISAWKPVLNRGRSASLCLTFDPSTYASDKPRNKRQTTPQIQVPVHACRWMTPRHGNVSAANILTQRTLRDLPSQVRFECTTPDQLRSGQIAPEFVEYLMGFPIGWTHTEGI